MHQNRRKNIHIAFTSIGRRVELVRAFKNAYSNLGLEGNIVGMDMDPLAAALRLADRRYIVPPLTSPDYLPTLVDICRKESIQAVFPLIDPDIPLLAKNRKLLEDVSTRVWVVSPEAAEITSDKSLTTRFFQELGLNVPWTLLPQEVRPSEIPFPVLIKPRSGSAGRDVFTAQNLEELNFFLKKVQDPILQEPLPGPEITTDVICDLESNLLGIVSRRRLEVRAGEVSKGVTIFDQSVLDDCVRIAKALPAIGAITVQCMMKGTTPHFTEINARFGGGSPLGIAAGVDSPRWLLARIAGLPVAIPPLGTYQRNLFMTRRDESFFLTESDEEKLSGRYL